MKIRANCLCFSLFLFVLAGCSLSPNNAKLALSSFFDPETAELKKIVDSLSLAEKSSQVLMTGIGGKTVFPPYLKNHFQGLIPGAVLLFGYNISDTAEGIHGFIQSCNQTFDELDASIPPLFTIDHEGGLVYRTGRVTTRIPSAESVARNLSPQLARSLYYEAGTQLSLLGINMNLAPVAEIANPENTLFLGSRAYSSSAEIVENYTTAAINGYRTAGIIPVIKHFPGNAAADPHAGLPVLKATGNEFETTYVDPFRKLLPEGIDAILVSHIIVESVEAGVPFCLSKKGVTGVLRDELDFHGLIITDDISMGAIVSAGYSSPRAAVLAISAGCDMVMTSDRDIRSIAAAIANEAQTNQEFSERLDEAILHILRVKKQAGLVKKPDESYSENEKNVSYPELFDAIAFRKSRDAGDKILEGIYDK